MAADRTDDDEIGNDKSAGVAVDSAEEAPEKLNLDVQVTSPGACERHVTVTISRDDIDRYFDDAFGELMPTAAVPGFRIGRAPRKVVENRYRGKADLFYETPSGLQPIDYPPTNVVLVAEKP